MATLTSTLKCPQCSLVAVEQMPVDACVAFYECQGCHTLLSPKAGSCCVFCSYGDTPCPSVQDGNCRSGPVDFKRSISR
jgi:hypothetical protein